MSMLTQGLKRLGHNVSAELQRDLDEIEKHPAYLGALALGPAGPLLAATLGRNVRGGVHAFDKATRPTHRAPRRPIAPPGIVAPSSAGGLNLATGKCNSGDLPYLLASVIRLAAAGAIVQDTSAAPASIGDFFTTTNSGFFTVSNQFPNPFQSFKLAGAITSQSVIGGQETAAFLDSGYLVMTVQTEIARYPLDEVGFAQSKETLVATATGSANSSAQYSHNAGVEWVQYFDPKSRYSWQVRYPRGVAVTTGGIDWSMRMTGLLKQSNAIGFHNPIEDLDLAE